MVHPARTCLASPPTPLSLESQEKGYPDGGLDLSNLSPGLLEMSSGGPWVAVQLGNQGKPKPAGGREALQEKGGPPPPGPNIRL